MHGELDRTLVGESPNFPALQRGGREHGPVHLVAPGLSAASTADMPIANFGPSPSSTVADYMPGPTSSAVDAANAVNNLATDMFGQAPYDEPSVVNSGFGPPDYRDMGAIERVP